MLLTPVIGFRMLLQVLEMHDLIRGRHLQWTTPFVGMFKRLVPLWLCNIYWNQGNTPDSIIPILLLPLFVMDLTNNLLRNIIVAQQILDT